MKHKPWQQGHFDGLCGIYSLINSMMLLHPGTFIEGDCEKLFAHLIGASAFVPNVVCDGLDFEPLCIVADTLPMYMQENHGSTIRLAKPFVEETFESAEDYLDCIGMMIPSPRDCALIGLGEPWGHWTVVTKVTKKAVRFHDSYGIKRFDKRVLSLNEGEGVIALDYRETIVISRVK